MAKTCKNKKVALTGEGTEKEKSVVELYAVEEVDPDLIHMTTPNTLEDNTLKEELFWVNIQVKRSLVRAIIYTGSMKHLISEANLRSMGLLITPHSKPYLLGWIQDGQAWRSPNNVLSNLLSLSSSLKR